MRQLFGSAKHRLATCLGGVVLLGAVCATSPAFAAEDAVVEALIQRGIQLRRNSADEDALAVFLEAEKQDPTSVRVLLHVVTAAQAAGKWLMADAYMKKVSALSDDPYYRRHADAIEVVRRSIAARVGSFHVQGGPDGASVRLDGQLVGTLPMAEPTSIEAGAYLMEVHKPGYYRLRRNVTISGGVLTREPVELNQAVVRGDLGAGAGTGSGSGALDGEANQSWWSSPAVGWTMIGLGVASGAVSGVAFAMREDSVERFNSEAACVPGNRDTRIEACGSVHDDIETAETVSLVTGIAGVALLGAGITHLIVTGGDEEESPVTSSPADEAGLKVKGCSAGLLSIACQGSF
jgi:hypothetical protein